MDNLNKDNNNHEKRPGPVKGGKNQQSLLAFLICLLVTLVFFSIFSSFFRQSSSEISYDKFIDMIENNQIKSVTLQSEVLTIEPKSSQVLGVDKTYYTNQLEDENELTKRLEGTGITFQSKPPDALGEFVSILVSVLLPSVLMFGMLMLFMRRMRGSGVMGMGKSMARTHVTKETGITFRDVAGEEEAKESLQEVVEFLHNPEKYVKIGAKLPKGALLVGPPGTGKTLLAKAVAGEAKVPFFSLSGSEFVEMFVGVGASRVRDLFEEAKKNAPCIVFIDEIDAIGKSRDSRFSGGNDEREQTLNQLLAEMDGFDTSKGLLILAATNRPEVLDPALLRPGRFDRRVIVDRPDLKGRIEILKVHAREVSLDETVDFDAIALATSGAVGSDLANMINEAAILAVKNGRRAVSQKDLFEAVEVVLVGKEKKDRILSVKERRIVSYHEVGHALISALLKDAEPVQKITIVPRTMGALGYVMQVPEEEKYLNTKAELESMLIGLLGGRAAEELVFETVTTGAANDIEKATRVARAMITQYGMSEKFGLMSLASVEDQYLNGRVVMNCGDDTATEIDHEVMALLAASYEEARRLLREHRKSLDSIAEYLIKRETITGKEFMKIFRAAEQGIPIPDDLSLLQLPVQAGEIEGKPEKTAGAGPGSVEAERNSSGEAAAPVSGGTAGPASGEATSPSTGEAAAPASGDEEEAAPGEASEHALGGTEEPSADRVSDTAAAGASESASGKAPVPSRSYDEWLDFVRDTTGADQRRDQGDSDGAE